MGKITIKDVTYDEIETLLDTEEIEEYFDETDIIQNEDLGKDAIIVYPPAYRVTDKNLIFLEGTYCNYDYEKGEFEPDFSLTLIYDNVKNDESFNLKEYLYFEQDYPKTTVYNFLNIAKTVFKLDKGR